MLGLAMRFLTVFSLLGLGGVALWENRTDLLAMASAQGAKGAADPVRGPSGRPIANTIAFRADKSGHVRVDVAVNGSPVRFLVDTGATLVALRIEDARAAGINPATLRFDERVSTANGLARVAHVKLRELRLDQLVVEDVEAVVIDAPLGISLLGMSFLKRLEGYEMRDGQLVVSW
jgi:aspartyl protease family protein